MRSRIDRHLGLVLGDSGDAARFDVAAAAAPPPPEELNGRDYAIFLLRVAAEIEHALMVQYLFVAYTLGRPGAPTALADQARAWQETILGIAKEEMAHLVTVQNLLVALGGPVGFERDDYPNPSPFYPFGFQLRPAGLEAVATYVCAESPADWEGAEADEIMELARADVGAPVNRVGELFAEIARVLGDPELVPDDAFDPASRDFQATWDEWGRGYREGQRGSQPTSALPGLPLPELLVLPVTTRAGALAAVAAVGEQGEAFETPADDDDSHFRRFLAVYRAMKALGGDLAAVVRPVATNPTTAAPLDTEPADPDPDPDDPDTLTPIRHPEARLWAQLSNIRYRKLLVGLTHAFDLAGPATRASARGALVNRSFTEMYQLRTIAGLLVRLPLDDAEPDGPRAGPPFQMPYTLALPRRERDRWRVHRDLLDASSSVLARLKERGVSGDGQDYLLALAQSDEIERGQVERLIAGAGSTG